MDLCTYISFTTDDSSLQQSVEVINLIDKTYFNDTRLPETFKCTHKYCIDLLGTNKQSIRQDFPLSQRFEVFLIFIFHITHTYVCVCTNSVYLTIMLRLKKKTIYGVFVYI